jgi:hypothetical protein
MLTKNRIYQIEKVQGRRIRGNETREKKKSAMDFEKQRILRLEATTHRRSNDLRRAFNQALVAGGKRPLDESSKSTALAAKRQKINPNLFNLPEAVQISILKQNSCQDIMNFFNSQKRIPTFPKEQWEALTTGIDCEAEQWEAFDRLEQVETITKDEGQYTRVDFYRNDNGEVDVEVRDAANDFATKCLFRRLKNTYKFDGMKMKWYSSLREWWRQGERSKSAQEDAERFFLHFTDVTTIGYQAFWGDQLTDVTIPNSVTTIGEGAFDSNQLTKVTIPNSVTTIEDAAFDSNQLTKVTIPNSVTTIGFQAFHENKLTKVTIPNSVTTIGEGAFRRNQLTEVTIPNSVTTIEAFAFDSNQLTKVTIPNSVTTIGFQAFAENKLTKVTIPNSVTTIGEEAFVNNQLTEVTIPNSVTTIGDGAFYGNQLTKVTIPNSVTTIGEGAFLRNRLTEVTIPKSVTTIGESAFSPNFEVEVSEHTVTIRSLVKGQAETR